MIWPGWHLFPNVCPYFIWFDVPAPALYLSVCLCAGVKWETWSVISSIVNWWIMPLTTHNDVLYAGQASHTTHPPLCVRAWQHFIIRTTGRTSLIVTEGKVRNSVHYRARPTKHGPINLGVVTHCVGPMRPVKRRVALCCNFLLICTHLPDHMPVSKLVTWQ